LAATLPELVALMRARPDAYGFGHTGTGGIGHLIGERLMAATGTRMVSVPYRGFQQTVIDVMSGRLAMTFESIANFLPFLREGQVRLLAVSSEQRLPQLHDVPTFAEAGYPDMVVESWLAVWAPAGTPREVVSGSTGRWSRRWTAGLRALAAANSSVPRAPRPRGWRSSRRAMSPPGGGWSSR
jgi:tripartite-type tricarboxylate transporter receptor subunit TctC